jgi:hypothetical protein
MPITFFTPMTCLAIWIKADPTPLPYSASKLERACTHLLTQLPLILREYVQVVNSSPGMLLAMLSGQLDPR